MANLPAFCNNCGLIFQSGYRLDGVQAEMIDSGAMCPRCRGFAAIPNGVYDVRGEVIKLLSGPATSRERLKRYRDLLVQIAEESRSDQELEHNLRTRLPDIAEIIERYVPQHRQFLIGVLIGTLGLLYGMQPQRSGATVAEIEAAFGRALEQYTIERSAE